MCKKRLSSVTSGCGLWPDDPRTGQPASGVLSATVLADTAAEADALATAAYILGPQSTRRLRQFFLAKVFVLVSEETPRL